MRGQGGVYGVPALAGETELRLNRQVFRAASQRTTRCRLKAFRTLYPKGNNYLVCPVGVPPYLKQAGNLEVKVCDPAGIAT